MNKLIGWLILLISICLLLPLFGLEFEKIYNWTIAIALFLISIIWLVDKGIS